MVYAGSSLINPRADCIISCMSQLNDGASNAAPKQLDSFEGWPLDKKVIVATVMVVILSFGGCVAASIQEIAALKPKSIVLLAAGGEKHAVPDVVPKPKIHPMKFLPVTPSNFNVLTRQQMAGAAQYAAEGIYVPTDDGDPSGNGDLLSKPRNVYVNITYHLTASAANKSLRQWMTGYPKSRETVPVRQYDALVGFSEDNDTVLVGWTEGSYSFQVDGSFTESHPTGEEDLLKKMALTIAEDIADQTRVVLHKTN